MSWRRVWRRLRRRGGVLSVALVALLGVATVALVAVAMMPKMVESAPAQQTALGLTGSTPTASSKSLTVAFIGDSYTAGAGVLPQDAWPSVLAAKRGWKVVNLARGGTGYLAAWTSGGQKACGQDVCPNYLGMVPQVVAASPDVVIVSGGRNDGTKLMPEIQQNITAVYTELRKDLPKAKIVATSPILAADDQPSSFPEFKAAVKSAVESVGGTYLDLGAPLGGHPELIGPDGVHPNTAGQKALADVIDKLLPELS